MSVGISRSTSHLNRSVSTHVQLVHSPFASGRLHPQPMYNASYLTRAFNTFTINVYNRRVLFKSYYARLFIIICSTITVKQKKMFSRLRIHRQEEQNITLKNCLHLTGIKIIVSLPDSFTTWCRILLVRQIIAVIFWNKREILLVKFAKLSITVKSEIPYEKLKIYTFGKICIFLKSSGRYLLQLD